MKTMKIMVKTSQLRQMTFKALISNMDQLKVDQRYINVESIS